MALPQEDVISGNQPVQQPQDTYQYDYGRPAPNTPANNGNTVNQYGQQTNNRQSTDFIDPFRGSNDEAIAKINAAADTAKSYWQPTSATNSEDFQNLLGQMIRPSERDRAAEIRHAGMNFSDDRKGLYRNIAEHNAAKRWDQKEMAWNSVVNGAYTGVGSYIGDQNKLLQQGADKRVDAVKDSVVEGQRNSNYALLNKTNENIADKNREQVERENRNRRVMERWKIDNERSIAMGGPPLPPPPLEPTDVGPAVGPIGAPGTPTPISGASAMPIGAYGAAQPQGAYNAPPQPGAGFQGEAYNRALADQQALVRAAGGVPAAPVPGSDPRTGQVSADPLVQKHYAKASEKEVSRALTAAGFQDETGKPLDSWITDTTGQYQMQLKNIIMSDAFQSRIQAQRGVVTPDIIHDAALHLAMSNKTPGQWFSGAPDTLLGDGPNPGVQEKYYRPDRPDTFGEKVGNAYGAASQKMNDSFQELLDYYDSDQFKNASPWEALVGAASRSAKTAGQTALMPFKLAGNLGETMLQERFITPDGRNVYKEVDEATYNALHKMSPEEKAQIAQNQALAAARATRDQAQQGL